MRTPIRTPTIDKLLNRLEEQVDTLAVKGELDNLINECAVVMDVPEYNWYTRHMAGMVINYANCLHASIDKEA